MLISNAYAQATDMALSIDPATAPAAPSPLWNFGMLVVMIVLFYVLLIMPQQKRFKEHSKMLSALEKGDRIITGGGLVGTVSKVLSDEEVEVDLGNAMIVTVKRSTIGGKADDAPAALKAAEKPKKAEKKAEKPAVAANESKPAPAPKKPAAKKPAAKKPAAKKAAAPKKTAAKKAPAKKSASKKA